MNIERASFFGLSSDLVQIGGPASAATSFVVVCGLLRCANAWQQAWKTLEFAVRASSGLPIWNHPPAGTVEICVNPDFAWTLHEPGPAGRWYASRVGFGGKFGVKLW